MVFDCINSRSMASSLLCIPSFVTTNKLFTKVLKQWYFLELWLTTYMNTLVNVYVDLVVFTRIAGTSYTGSGRYWC